MFIKLKPIQVAITVDHMFSDKVGRTCQTRPCLRCEQNLVKGLISEVSISGRNKSRASSPQTFEHTKVCGLVLQRGKHNAIGVPDPQTAAPDTTFDNRLKRLQKSAQSCLSERIR